jgi:hypothetical protein
MSLTDDQLQRFARPHPMGNRGDSYPEVREMARECMTSRATIGALGFILAAQALSNRLNGERIEELMASVETGAAAFDELCVENMKLLMEVATLKMQIKEAMFSVAGDAKR